MPNLRQIITDKGYTASDLILRWPGDGNASSDSRRRYVNRVLEGKRQEHIDMVNGLPTKPGDTRGGWT